MQSRGVERRDCVDFWSNAPIVAGSYANGVTFQNPGSSAVRGAPWDRVTIRIANPNGVLQPSSCRTTTIDRSITIAQSNLSNPVGVIADMEFSPALPMERGYVATLSFGM
jgi:hypothetical protein